MKKNPEKRPVKKPYILFIVLGLIIAIVALVFVVAKPKLKNLTIYSEAGYKIKSYPINENGTFSVSHMSSESNNPIVEFYKTDKENNIYLFRTIYYQYGAKEPTGLMNGQKVTYGEDGSMVIDGVDIKIDNLTYFLSEQSDYILTVINKKAYSLWNDCGKNVNIVIKIEE